MKRLLLMLGFCLSAQAQIFLLPYTASQFEVDLGLNGNKAVTPFTLDGYFTDVIYPSILANGSGTNLDTATYYSWYSPTSYWVPTFSWLNEKGQQFFIASNSMGPLIVTNNRLTVSPTWTNTTTTSFLYVGCSNALPYNTIGANVYTEYLPPGGTNGANWTVCFSSSPTPHADISGINVYNGPWVHAYVDWEYAVICLYSNGFSGTAYSLLGGQMDPKVFAKFGGGSIHNWELRRTRSDTVGWYIDNSLIFQVTDTNLPMYWGTNVWWETCPNNIYDTTRVSFLNVYARNDPSPQAAPNGPTPVSYSSQFLLQSNVVSLVSNIYVGAITVGGVNGVGGATLSIEPASGWWQFSGGSFFYGPIYGGSINGSSVTATTINGDGSGLTGILPRSIAGGYTGIVTNWQSTTFSNRLYYANGVVTNVTRP
jgi:hypothetical protein